MTTGLRIVLDWSATVSAIPSAADLGRLAACIDHELRAPRLMFAAAVAEAGGRLEISDATLMRIGDQVLHVHEDLAHHRTVFQLVGQT